MERERRTLRWLWTTAALALLATGAASPALAETAAGTGIVNFAQVRADGIGPVSSAPNTIIVAERLDLTLTRLGDDPATAGQVVAVRLVNTGNGQEAFRLSASGGGATPALAIDRNGDGRLDAGDTVLADGRTETIAPGATLTVLVSVPADASLQVVTVRAEAQTGSGTPGTGYPGEGDGGGDAVDGSTGAGATIDIPLAAGAMPTLTKRQAVRAPDGSSQAVAGAVITYTLEARFPGAVADARIDDPVPAGTEYLPGSLSLDGTPLSDGADADAGDASAAAVAVRLGAVPAAAAHTVQFRVAIR